MKFHYARHGQPILPYDDNFEKNDSLFLSNTGVLQARELATRLIGSGITRIITSDFPRAIHTGAIAGKILGVTQFKQTHLLNEVHHGNLTTENFKQWLATGIGESDKIHVPGSTVAEIRQRLRQFLTEFQPDEQTLVVAHGLLFSVLLLEAAGFPDETPVLDNPNNIELGYAENRLVEV
jgi:broad specificity phosphatase PhoE